MKASSVSPVGSFWSGACSRLLTGAVSLLVLSGYASVFTVVNVRTNAVAWSGAVLTYPAGVTSIPLDSSPASLVSALGSDFGVTVDPALSYTAEITGPGPSDYSVSSSSGSNRWLAFGAGMGVGFMWFGFGWCLRLTKRVGDF